MSKGPSTESKPKAPAPKREVRPAALLPQRTSTHQGPALLQRAMDDPTSLSSADVSALQRQFGNTAVAGLLARRGSAAPTAAAAPAVQRAPDQTEDDEQTTEAEPTAAPATQAAQASSSPEDDETISRQADPLAEGDDVQRAPQIDDDAGLQRKPAVQPMVGLAGGPVEDSLERQIQSQRGGGTPLPGGVRGKVEGALDADLSGVRVHTGQTSDTLNRSLGARAFTTGSDIFFKEGEYNPASSGGQSLLAHELTHVVQQGAAVRRRTSRSRR